MSLSIRNLFILSALTFGLAGPLAAADREWFQVRIDRQVGRLLEGLDRLKLRERTLVVFVSDHGYLMGEHNMWKKSVLWEEAIRVPLMVAVPGGLKDLACDRIVELVDLYPTLTELAGLPQEAGAQGLSLVPLLRDPQATLPRKHALIQVGAGFGLRSDRWAYMWYPARRNLPEGFMLYDMEHDPYQRTNLAARAEHADTVERLHAALKRRVAQAK